MKNLSSHLSSSAAGGLKIVHATSLQTLLIGGIKLAHDQIATHEIALCTIEVDAQWKTRIPLVFCHEPWLRTEVDWHVLEGRRLCVDLQERWADFIQLAGMLATPQALEEFTADYLLHSIRWLLYRHLYGYQNGITIWPKEWDAWAHGSAGRQEYLNQLQNN